MTEYLKPVKKSIASAKEGYDLDLSDPASDERFSRRSLVEPKTTSTASFLSSSSLFPPIDASKERRSESAHKLILPPIDEECDDDAIVKRYIEVSKMESKMEIQNPVQQRNSDPLHHQLTSPASTNSQISNLPKRKPMIKIKVGRKASL